MASWHFWVKRFKSILVLHRAESVAQRCRRYAKSKRQPPNAPHFLDSTAWKRKGHAKLGVCGGKIDEGAMRIARRGCA